MLKKVSFLFLLLAWFTHAYAVTPLPSSHAEIVKQIISQYMDENDVPGVAVELYIEGKPESYYFGYANPNIKQLMNKNTIVEIGSLSKVMTSLLFAQEVDAAKMQLNAPVRKYLPWLSDDFDDITMMNLATHTSGLPMKQSEDMKNQQALTQFLATYYPDYTSNEQWIYSNLNIGILGFALEKVTHRKLNELYINQILFPLGMQPIGLVVPPWLLTHYAMGYNENGDEVKPLPTSLLPAAGAVKASAQDMQRFLSAAIGLPGTPEHILYPMRMTQSVYVELPTKMQGLGWEVHPLETNDIKDLLKADDNLSKTLAVTEVYSKPRYSGDMLIDKSGGTPGFRVYIAVIPNKKTGIVILTNKFVSGSAIARTGREILFRLNNLTGNESDDSNVAE